MNIRGSCLCKAVTYEIEGAPGPIGHCHCSLCRKAHGAAFATWMLIEAGQFRFTSGAESVVRYASSPRHERCFCGQCGASLAAGHDGLITEVALGTVDGDPGVRPEAHIFVGSKAQWHEITDSLPQYLEWPPGMGE